MRQIDKIFVFIGPPGAGKGSLANLCSKNFGWMQVSTGNLCRKHIAEKTKIGKEIDLIIKSGKLIGDDIITDMVFDWLSENIKNTQGVILDGYPRTTMQAEAFDLILQKMLPDAQKIVVVFLVSDDVVVSRLCRRFICTNIDCQAVYSVLADEPCGQAKICDECGGILGRRSDDEEVAVRKRLMIYHKHAQDLIDFYQAEKAKIIKIDCSKPLQEVFSVFCNSINN